MKEKKHLSFEAENLAMPEIHVHTDEAGEKEEKPCETEGKTRLDFKYDNLAVPEVVVEDADQNETDGGSKEP